MMGTDTGGVPDTLERGSDMGGSLNSGPFLRSFSKGAAV